MTGQPQVSIVMPCYQQVEFLAEAVRSVLDQDGVAVELLVFDPGSTDGSRALLERLRDCYGDRLLLHFAPDQGQSDAINKGMAAARGDILGWLNSDDRLEPGALARVASALGGTDKPAWTYGQAAMIDQGGRRISNWIVRYKAWRGRRFSRLKLLAENFIPQMAVFWNRAMWRSAGGLDPDKHFDMDYDLWLRFAEVQEPVVLPVELAAFRVHAAAKSSRNVKDQLRAAYRTARHHLDERGRRLGWRGRLALAMHRLLGWRTRLCYLWLKPR